MLSFIPKPVKTILFPWAVVFLVLQLANTQDGGPNAVSRFVTMRAMGEMGSFQIDYRKGATSDWSQGPDGHYYSNKAPGPMLLGFPTFFLIDQIPRLWERGYRDEFGTRHAPGYFTRTWTSIVNQALPLLLLLALILAWLGGKGVSARAQTFFILSALFGTTASLYYNNYSGHGFEAILQLATLFFLLRGDFGWAGFFGGSSLLSEYGFASQIPGFLVALFLAFRAGGSWPKHLARFSAGAVLPAVLWVWYHWACFGGPFHTAVEFNNPIFLDADDGRPSLWGIFHLPSPGVVWELIAGPSRGLLPTQPWVLLAIPLAWIPWRWTRASAPGPKVGAWERHTAAAYCVLGLIGLILMNAAFGKWQGGNSAGPRYIAGVLPCFGLWLALELDRLPRLLRLAFEALLGVSLAFRAFVYGSTILAPGLPLWAWYYSEYATHQWTPQLRCAIFVLLLGLGFWWQRRRMASASAAGGALAGRVR